MAAAAAVLLGSAGISAAQLADICDGISPLPAGALVTTRLAIGGLSLPIFVTAPAGDVDRLFVVEQAGRILLHKNGVTSTFLDLRTIVRSPASGGGQEEGLLGLAFHPDYAANGFLFVYHTNFAGNQSIVRYQRSATDPDVGNLASRSVVTTISHPGQSNHNGGMMAFGPGPGDGNLYIGVGDGGSGCDPLDNAQNGNSRLGKILRINVDSLPFSIPGDNPFTGTAGVLDEIWATGVRNPWRFSFDRETFDLYIGDVGQAEWEEIDFQPAASVGGENYGWDLWEGDHCPNPSCFPRACTLPLPPRVDPVAEYSHAAGFSVTGGYVYRGCRYPGLRGTYFYADFGTAFIRSFRIVAGAPIDPILDWATTLDPPGPATITAIASFGEDARGELYIVERDGEVWKIVPPLRALEVSGANTAPFTVGLPDWTWEDLDAVTLAPLAAYRVYRRASGGPPLFECRFEGPTPIWPGGDPASPLPGEVFTYVVTALENILQETSPGTGRDGEPRLLSAAACP